MVAFIDDQMTVISDDISDLAIPHQALDQSDIDNTCWFSFPAANDADLFGVDVQKRTQALYPLREQFPTVNENQSIATSVRNKRCGDNRLAKGCRGGKHAIVVGGQSIESPQLWLSQCSLERNASG